MRIREKVKVIHRAADLPETWDTCAGDRLFLHRNSLCALEEVNPCGQRYHIVGEKESCSIAVTYQHRLNLFTYGRGSFNLPTTIVGIPCSVSDAGHRITPDTTQQMVSHLHEIKGAKLVLNAPDPFWDGFKYGRTLPSCRLGISWDQFPGYLTSLRSHYRYRITQALSRGAIIEKSAVKHGVFGRELYQLYENVFNRSRYKLEKLSLDFFNRFPSEIVQFTVENQPIAFVQTVHNGKELIFLFAGMDYSSAKQYDTYLNILLYIIQKGIEEGCATISMGQTATEMKCKLGCEMEPRHMHIAHSNRIGNLILRSFSGLLDYNQQEHQYRVFKSLPS